MTTYDSLRRECCEANRRLGASGLVDLTFGNVSVLDRQSQVFAIKPSGVPYSELLPEHMVLVHLAGGVVAGDLRPSSDTPTHACLLAAFSGIRAVVHTHSRAATAFAQAGRELPCLGTTHADYFRGPVPITRALSVEQIGGAYELETGKVIVERFAALDPLSRPAVLVRGHGPFVWGTSGDHAVETAQALELVAAMALATLALHPATPDLPTALVDKHFLRKHGPAGYYGQPGSSG